MRKHLHTLARTGAQPVLLAVALAVLLAATASSAQARVGLSVDLNLGLPLLGYPGHFRGGPAYGSVHGALPYGAVSLSIGGGRYWRHGGAYYRPWGPRWVVVAPPIVLGATLPLMVQQADADAALPALAPAAPAARPSRPDPVIYPRNGQSPEQTEADRQDCNRWATTQPAALADAGVFHRAVEACMDGRGYTLK